MFYLKNINVIYNRLFCCNHTCNCVDMLSVTSVSRYETSALRFQTRSLMYIRGLIPRNSTELAKSVLRHGEIIGPGKQKVSVK